MSSKIEDEGGLLVWSNPEDLERQKLPFLCCENSEQPFQPRNKEVLVCQRWAKLYGHLVQLYSLVICMYNQEDSLLHLLKAIQQQSIPFFNKTGEPTFTTYGFDKWKKALEIFKGSSPLNGIWGQLQILLSYLLLP